MRSLIIFILVMFSIFFFTFWKQNHNKNEHSNNSNQTKYFSLFLEKYNPKLEAVSSNLLDFIYEETQKETDGFFQILEVPTHKMYPIQLADSISNRIFSSLKDDKDIIECRVLLLSQKLLIFSFKGLNDSLNCIPHIIGEKTENISDSEIETYLGLAEQCVVKDPNEKRAELVDLSSKLESKIFYLEKRRRVKERVSFRIELFVKNKDVDMF